MFTGIVGDVGRVKGASRRDGLVEFEIESAVAKDLKPGDSVCVNGVCLTATRSTRRRFSVEAIGETLAKTNLGDLEKGSPVNLEAAVRPLDRLGGHLLQGHVDGTAQLEEIQEDGGSLRTWWRTEQDILKYLVPKGSVAVNGISLTVVETRSDKFQVALIPHTLEVTTFGSIAPGAIANVEVDIVAKYIERLVTASAANGR